MASTIRVVDYDERYRDDFARLNIEWLERWFTVEPVDIEVLHQPEEHVLASGGQIFFALDSDGDAVGTAALRYEGAGIYELTKMAVNPSQRGTGVGRLLMNTVLEAFQRLGGTELYLESNTRLGPALTLYESVGFVHQDGLRPGSIYGRANVYMIWKRPPPS